jgi:hypothetical protein
LKGYSTELIYEVSGNINRRLEWGPVWYCWRVCKEQVAGSEGGKKKVRFKIWIYHQKALPRYVFMAWCSVKHRGNFTFAFKHIRVK